MRNLVLLFLLALTTGSNAWACQPCAETWDLSKTTAQADAIIIGKRITPRAENEDTRSGPTLVEIEVQSVLKGMLEDQVIRARAWTGMCTYGIITPPQEPYILFLKKDETGQVYDSINYGCAVKALKIMNEQVLVEDKLLSMEQFKHLLNNEPN